MRQGTKGNIAADSEVWDLFKTLTIENNNDSSSHSHVETDTDTTACAHCLKADTVSLIDGDYVCTSCGCINSRFIDHGAEWRNFMGDDSKGANMMRCGMPVNSLMPDAMLGSLIGFGNARETQELRIMRKYHMWNSTSYKERSLYTVFDSLSLNAMNNGISKSIIEEAKALYKKVSDMKITRGNNRSGLIAASVYMACKNNKVPRSTKEIAGFFNVKLAVMTKSCKRFQEMLKTNIKSTNAEDFISRFGSKINLDKHQKDLCRMLIMKAEEEDLVSDNIPPSIAAGAIFACSMMYDWKIDKKELAEACEVSQVTITKCSKKMLVCKDMLTNM